jgi:1-acyl-sn-glycerol-3-phosphate acyltransferase
MKQTLRLIEGERIWPASLRRDDLIQQALGRSLDGEPVVVYPEGNRWAAHSIRVDQVPLIPKDAITAVYEARRVCSTLFPESGRLYVLSQPVELVFVAPESWGEAE